MNIDPSIHKDQSTNKEQKPIARRPAYRRFLFPFSMALGLVLTALLANAALA